MAGRLRVCVFVALLLEHRSTLVVRRIRSRIRLGYLVLGIEFSGFHDDETDFLLI